MLGGVSCYKERKGMSAVSDIKQFNQKGNEMKARRPGSVFSRLR